MKSDKAKYLLALNTHPKIGSQTIKKVLASFPDLEELWQAPEQEIFERLEQKIASLVIEARLQIDPSQALELLKKYNIGFLTIFDKGYPQLLSEAYDCPVVLYIRGQASALNQPGIAIVGSRRVTSYGKRVATDLARSVVASGLAIYSGLALGIDGEAHRATVDSGGTTVGVLACGLDRIYPSSHLDLAKRIINNGGAIISEQPPGTAAFKQNFPARNRIIAGLSLGTVVIEAAEKSGALITAYCALEYNREVFAIPGDIDKEFSKGCNRLIQKGAKLVMGIDDILSELNISVKKAEMQTRQLSPITENEAAIVEILRSGEQHVDEIVLLSRLNVIAINSALTMLEMKGMIENIGGGRYKRIC